MDCSNWSSLSRLLIPAFDNREHDIISSNLIVLVGEIYIGGCFTCLSIASCCVKQWMENKYLTVKEKGTKPTHNGFCIVLDLLWMHARLLDKEVSTASKHLSFSFPFLPFLSFCFLPFHSLSFPQLKATHTQQPILHFPPITYLSYAGVRNWLVQSHIVSNYVLNPSLLVLFQYLNQNPSLVSWFI